jgi:hypothetical protein
MVIISLRVNQRQSSVAGWGGNWLRRLLWLAANPPSQVTGHQIYQHAAEHQNHAKPDAPIPMRASPIRRLAVMNRATIRISVRFVIVL